MFLERNHLFEWLDASGTVTIHRVLQVDSDYIVTINVNNSKALPSWHKRVELEAIIEDGNINILQNDPFEAALPFLEELSTAQRKHLELAWEVVYSIHESGELAFLPKERSNLIQQASKRTGRSEKAIRKDLRRFWQGGLTKLAIVARFNKRGGKGQERTSLKEDVKWAKKRERIQGRESKLGSNIYKRGRRSTLSVITGETIGIVVDDTIREAIVQGGRNAFKTPGMTYVKACQKTLETQKCFHNGYKLEDGVVVPNLKPAEQVITIHQFKYWYKKDRDRDFTKELLDRVGNRAYNLHHRPIGGDSTARAFGPGSIFQIDSTIADIYLRHSLNRKWLIGRPTLYLVVDLFSRLIAGFAVTLEPPSWLGVMLALDNTASDKAEFCRSFGIDISPDEWPCAHLPEQIVADHQEFDGYNANNLVDAMGIEICLAPPFRPDLKAVIERSFRWFNDEQIHWFLGASKKTIRERGERDPRLDGVLTPDEFRKLMILCILDHNNERLL